MHVHVGDIVQVNILDGKRPQTNLPVVGMIYDYLGLAAYTSLSTLNRLMNDGAVVTAVDLLVDTKYLNHFFQTLRELPRVSTVKMKSTLINV